MFTWNFVRFQHPVVEIIYQSPTSTELLQKSSILQLQRKLLQYQSPVVHVPLKKSVLKNLDRSILTYYLGFIYFEEVVEYGYRLYMF